VLLCWGLSCLGLGLPSSRRPPAGLLRVGLTPARELVGKLEANRDADEHAEPSLLGYKRAYSDCPLGLLGRSRDPAHLGIVRLPEPAPFGKRFGEHTLERRSGVHHDVLSVRETSGLYQRRKSCIDLGCGIRAIWQSDPIIGRWGPPGGARSHPR
jgi:hypothetical protein